MAAPIKPALSLANGKESWGFIPTAAGYATGTGPTVAELGSASGLNISCYLFSDQEGVTSETEKVTLPRRLCETVQYQSNGPTTFAMSDLTVAFDPQAAAGSNGKKAWETLVNGSTGYLWRRQGISGATDVAAGQFVDLIPAQIGPATPSKTGTEADAVFTSVHPVSVTNTPLWNVAILA